MTTAPAFFATHFSEIRRSVFCLFPVVNGLNVFSNSVGEILSGVCVAGYGIGYAAVHRAVIVMHPSACFSPCLCLRRRVHSFRSIDSQGAAISCIEPAPALDVAAVGLSDGRVQVLYYFKHSIGINY